MVKYPQLKINVKTHTDSRATDDYNLKLSEDRAKSIVNYITSKGIDGKITSIKNNTVLNQVPLEDIPITELYPIYFDFNKYDIKREGTVELDRIINLMMNVYPRMVIKIESHTDSRGTPDYNVILSEERAKATYNYLVKKGVDPVRISEYKGFGEQKLTNGCDGTKTCTEAQHQLNRRTQFIVIKMK